MGVFWLAPLIAGFAFPILPYELFFFMPWILAYLIEKADKKTANALVVFMTYWGGLYGGGVHTLALFGFLDSEFKLENFGFDGVRPEAGLCSALPPPTPGPWCVLLMGHVFLMLPMGYMFLILMFLERKKFGGFLSFGGPDPVASFYERAAFFFIIGGISGNLPYLGQLAIQGVEVFQGPGVYTDNGVFPSIGLPAWYNGRGYVEFGSYSSWFFSGFYFLIKACAKPSTGGPMM